MDQLDTQRSEHICDNFRRAGIGASVVLLPPFLVLAVVPMLVLLIPVAMVGIPFIVPALFSGSRAAREEQLRHQSWRPRPRLAVRWA